MFDALFTVPGIGYKHFDIAVTTYVLGIGNLMLGYVSQKAMWQLVRHGQNLPYLRAPTSFGVTVNPYYPFFTLRLYRTLLVDDLIV